jgi:hypothetical protein
MAHAHRGSGKTGICHYSTADWRIATVFPRPLIICRESTQSVGFVKGGSPSFLTTEPPNVSKKTLSSKVGSSKLMIGDQRFQPLP